MRVSRFILAAAPVLLLATACGGGGVYLPQADVESNVATQLAAAFGVAPEDLTVSCPGDLDGVVGTKMECNVTGPAGEAPIEVSVTSVENDKISFEINDAPA